MKNGDISNAMAPGCAVNVWTLIHDIRKAGWFDKLLRREAEIIVCPVAAYAIQKLNHKLNCNIYILSATIDEHKLAEQVYEAGLCQGFTLLQDPCYYNDYLANRDNIRHVMWKGDNPPDNSRRLISYRRPDDWHTLTSRMESE